MSNTGPLCRNAQSCIRTSSPASRRWHGQSLCPNCLVSLEIQPRWSGLLTSIVSDAHQKYSCTVRSIGGLQHLPPQMKNHGLNEEKPYRRKNNLSIELSDVNVWLVRILTTECKSLKRVETCQKNHFNFWLFVMLTHSSDLIFQTIFTLWIYIYIRVICSALNPWLFICIWMTSFLSRIWKDT
jgi:hypothetical protein